MRMTAKQYRNLNRGKKSKYGNKKVTLDGQTIDSRAEVRYYQQLKLLQQANEIMFFKTQPRYRLQHSFEKHGKKHRPIDYVADFEIHHNDGSIEVVDVKGTQTQI